MGPTVTRPVQDPLAVNSSTTDYVYYAQSLKLILTTLVSEGVPNLQLALVPKMLTPLVKHWVKEAFIVSFKLETDQELLVDKAR